MRGLLTTLLVLVAGCSAGDAASRYLDDARFRRDTLVASLVNPDNGYSRLRLAHYATGGDGDWDALPVWNPPVATLGVDGWPRADELALDGSAAGDDAARLALGEAAFFRYPVQLAPALSSAFGSLESLAVRGLWYDPTRGASLVSARLADGGRVLALTCASCHARVVDGVLVAGLPNEQIDLGWGPGRIDVAPPPGEEPIEIPDLRPVALETNLQRDGTVRNGGTATLAVRIETLIITSHAALIRPPRQVTWALALWLESLAPPPPASPALGSLEARGAELFAARCAACHAPPAFAGAPVPLAIVGTDPRVGLSAERGTGGYRVPSLRGVATRGRLLHDGSVPDVGALLDPTRAGGHRFGLDLPPDDSAALLSYVSAL